MAIVKSTQWTKALRNCTEAAWGGVTTPLRKLIRKMPGVQTPLLKYTLHGLERYRMMFNKISGREST